MSFFRVCVACVVAAIAAFSAVAAEAGNSVRFVRADAPRNGDGLSWSTAYKKVFAALDEAAVNPGITEIWVASGTHTPDRGQKNRNDTFTLVSGVTVYGGFDGTEQSVEERDPATNPTILSGDLKADDGPNFTKIVENSFHVVSAMNFSGAAATLDGVIVRAGNANLNPDDLLGGGGMFMKLAHVAVVNCLFTANSAGINQPSIGGFGGALYNLEGDVTVSDSAFIGNRGDNGGAVGVRDLNDGPFTAVFENCQFINNKANNQTGGAIWTGSNPFDTVERTLAIRGCLFEGNSAQYGGAIIDQNTKHTIIEDTTFRNNSAFVVGGAVWYNQTGGLDQEPMMMSRCTFEHNTAADNGGGIFMTAAAANITNTRFFGNVAEDGIGGAIRTGPQFGTNFGVGDLHLANCTFSGNSSGAFAGAVAAIRCPKATVAHCTFVQNTAGSSTAGLFSDCFNLKIDNSIFWNNKVGASMNQNAQLQHSPGNGPLMLNHTCVQGLTGSLGGSGNTSSDPILADADGADNTPGTGDEDLTLDPDSPAIEAGSVAGLPTDKADLDADGDTSEPLPLDLAESERTVGAAPDMGAFEFVMNAIPGDLNADGFVDGADLGLLLGNWGGNGTGDLNGDGMVDGADLGLLLGLWTT